MVWLLTDKLLGREWKPFGILVGLVAEASITGQRDHQLVYCWLATVSPKGWSSLSGTDPGVPG